MRTIPEEYSDFWLSGSDQIRTFFPPSSAPMGADWPIGKSYPVTAAQLSLILTGFLVPDCTLLAKNRRVFCAAGVDNARKNDRQ
jgi:hypothetical protein